MIAHLRGKLIARRPNQVVVDIAGVGYDVTISVPTFSELPPAGGEVALHVHTHVREDQLALYGFLRQEEKDLFEKLLTVSGIGPKLAITILSGMPVEEMISSIRGNDVARLTRIPGIGKKTAERMVMELRDKLTAREREPRQVLPALSAVQEDVMSALINLGYQHLVAEKALRQVVRNSSGESFESLFRECLALVSKPA
ncbi:MAG: Holliday junction branch migration protein RuvA [Acidobacteria bacterium]|nr:Holliday junction branch migration protein RuvA [Acidobacteriota bacterium]MBV9624938.1 Holliday junction branch migration protein RuvA [Acidobacteriota bacterium]